MDRYFIFFTSYQFIVPFLIQIMYLKLNETSHQVQYWPLFEVSRNLTHLGVQKIKINNRLQAGGQTGTNTSHGQSHETLVQVQVLETSNQQPA